MDSLSDYPFKHEFLNELIKEKIIKESIFCKSNNFFIIMRLKSISFLFTFRLYFVENLEKFFYRFCS